jgi:hypothetical protein
MMRRRAPLASLEERAFVTSAGSEGRRQIRIWLIAVMAVVNLGAAAVVRPVVADQTDSSDSSDEDPAASATPDETVPSGLIDPQLVNDGDGAWAVGSSLDGLTMPLFERNDDVWEEVEDALTPTPAWATQGFFSPSVVQDGTTWWLFYTAASSDTQRYCIGAASAEDPLAGFEPEEEPLRCTDDRDLLDPVTHRSSEGLFLAWAERSVVSETGTTSSTSSTTTTATTENEVWELAVATLDLTTSTVDDPTVLLTATGDDTSSWEGGVVDGPALVDVDGTLVLFYGGNRWGSADYGVGYATCVGVLGPCERQTVDEPLDLTSALGTEQSVDAVGSFQEAISVSTDNSPAVGFHGLRQDSTQQATEIATFEARVSWAPADPGASPTLSIDTPVELDLATD